MTITYKIENKIYVNLTNRCSNSCDFCVRITDAYKEYGLWLSREPSAAEVIAELGDLKDVPEVVFCGYGEPLYRLDAVLEIAAYVHSKGVKTRLNTNGQAKLICGFDVAPKLKGLIDTVSISLNATSAEKYQAMCHSEFGEDAYDELLSFAKELKDYVPRVVLSIVDIIGADEVEKAKKIAAGVGVELRVRAYIP